MKINNIKLTNYRSHSSFNENFHNGINLLLGKNGAGKSSILEAIGITLFGANPRTNFAETIKIGEKVAKVIIEFTGNDENNYRVERKIGNQSTTKLFVGSEEQERFSGTEAIKKIKELVGLKQNSDVIYKNVISAEQNKLTEIFQMTEARRAEEFNKIFNTEIYKRIFEKYSHDCLKSYTSEYDKISNEINIYSTTLMDVSILQNLLKNEEDELKNLEINERKIKNELENLENKQLDFDKKLKEINSLKNSISKNKARIEEKHILLQRLQSQYLAAKQASKIVDENQSSFLSYQELEKDIRILSEKIKGLEKLETNKRKIENELTKNDKELHTLNSKIISNNENIENKQSEIKIIKEKIQEFENESKSILIQLIEIEEILSKINLTKNEFSNINKNRQKNINDLESIKKIVQEKASRTINESIINSNIENFRIKLDLLEKNKSEKIKLETEKEQLNVRFKILTEAKNKLKGSICPYLEQKCKNIDDEVDSDIYFNGKLEDINLELSSINQSLKNLKGVENEIDDAKNQINSLNNQILNNKDLLIEIEKYEGNINLLSESLNSNLKDFEILLANYSLPLDYDLKDLEKTEKLIEKQLVDYNKVKAEKDSIRKNNEKNVTESNKRFVSLTNEIEKLNKENLENDNKIQILENQKKEYINKIKDLDSELIELPNLKNEYDVSNKEIDLLKPAYILYTKNLESAKNEFKIKNEIDSENEALSSLNEITNKLTYDLEQKNEESITEESKLNALLIKAENQKNAENANKIGIVNTSIESRKKEIKDNLEIEVKISKLKDQQKLLEKKINLSDLFRKKINVMGTIVASRLLTEIANKASENYFNISQKNEIIEWINDEQNKYQVYLIDKASKVKRKYEVLSGGEQVSVAISLRTALAESLTSASFAIFDEPTVNLDKERKELLSRSLHKMLEKLEQVLVVTHDNTFQEMAEAIEIGK